MDLQYGIVTENRLDCYLCGSSGRTLHQDCSDRLFGVPGTWTFKQCANDQCGLIWLDPRPTRATIGKAYHSYYTHDSSQVQRTVWANALPQQKHIRLSAKHSLWNPIHFHFQWYTQACQSIAPTKHWAPIARKAVFALAHFALPLSPVVACRRLQHRQQDEPYLQRAIPLARSFHHCRSSAKSHSYAMPYHRSRERSFEDCVHRELSNALKGRESQKQCFPEAHQGATESSATLLRWRSHRSSSLHRRNSWRLVLRLAWIGTSHPYLACPVTRCRELLHTEVLRRPAK